ncbi:integrase, catalytic region, zinc finger, CCHC-type containing protein [Tanacetum coccineum]
MLIPLAQDTMANASLFETHLEKEMFGDLKVDDLLMQECLTKDILFVTYMYMLDTNMYCDMADKYLDKIKECERLEFELSKHKEFLKNKPTNLSKPSLESENTYLKKTVAQFQKDFSKIEAHYVALELKYQNQTLKSGKHSHVLKDIDVIETINIKLEHSVATLFQENENLQKENEHLKQTYKDLFDSIKLTKSQTKVNNDYLIVQLNKMSMENADLKNQLQEKTNLNTQLRNVTIKRDYYVKGLNHNLFSVGQFCDADLEVTFRKSTCFVRDLQGNDLHTSTCGSDLHTISLQESSLPNPICFMAKASPTQAWLWHRRLSHLNFDTINLFSKNDIVNGLPKFKGIEFLNKTLQTYFKEEGISHQTTIAQTPEQNNVVERRNRTLVEAARTMFLVYRLPLFFWAEAIATACYTQNRPLIIP